MRVAALYDIHGNLPALEAVLAEVAAVRVDLVVVGGDFVMGPMPRATLERSGALGSRARFIRGNTERDLLGGMADNPNEPRIWATRSEWVAKQLDDDDRAFLAALPMTLQTDVDGLGPVLFCHGTPRNDDEIVTRATPNERILPALEGVSETTIVCGHTHMQFDRAVGATRLVNAGSVGLPYEGQSGAYWALLGPDVELKRTGYDFEAAARQICATGFPAAEDFARKYVLASPLPEEAVRIFETMARERSARRSHFEGLIKSGRGLGMGRMRDSALIERLQALAGFRVLPGTLNVRLPNPIARGPNWRYLRAAEISPGWHQQTRQAGYYLIRILIADRYRGLAFQADEPGYPADQIEVVSDVHIRSALGLTDGDRVRFSVVGWDDTR